MKGARGAEWAGALAGGKGIDAEGAGAREGAVGGAACVGGEKAGAGARWKCSGRLAKTRGAQETN